MKSLDVNDTVNFGSVKGSWVKFEDFLAAGEFAPCAGGERKC